MDFLMNSIHEIITEVIILDEGISLIYIRVAISICFGVGLFVCKSAHNLATLERFASNFDWGTR